MLEAAQVVSSFVYGKPQFFQNIHGTCLTIGPIWLFISYQRAPTVLLVNVSFPFLFFGCDLGTKEPV